MKKIETEFAPEKWAIVHINEYLTEGVELVDEVKLIKNNCPYSGEIFNKIDFIQDVKSKFNETDFKAYYCSSIINELNYYIEKSRKAIATLACVKIIVRLENILSKIENGESIPSACAPYAVKNNRYLNPSLYLQTENELKEKYLLKIKSQIEKLYSRFELDSTVLQPLADLYLDKECYKDLMYTILLRYGYYFKPLAKLLPDVARHSVIDSIIEKKEKVIFHDEMVMSIHSILVENKAGPLILANFGKYAHWLKMVESFDVFYLFKHLTIDENSFYQKLNLRPDDFFKVLLMKEEFDYQPHLNYLLENWSQNKSELKLILCEALVRGEREIASLIKNKTTKNEVKVTETTSKTKSHTEFFKVDKEIEHRSITTHDEAITIDINFLTTYIAQKHEIIAGKKDLFFITDAQGFLKMLKELDIIQDTSSLKKAMAKKFNIQFEVEMLDVDRTTRLEEEVIGLRQLSSHLQKTVSGLEKKYDDLEKKYNTLIKFLNAQRDAEMNDYSDRSTKQAKF